MKRNKKLMLTAIAAMGVVAMGVGGAGTFAWYKADSAAASGSGASAQIKSQSNIEAATVNLIKDTHFTISDVAAKKLVENDGTSIWYDASNVPHDATLNTTDFHGEVTFTLLAAGKTILTNSEIVGTYHIYAIGDNGENTNYVRVGSLVDGKYVGTNTKTKVGVIVVSYADSTTTVTVYQADGTTPISANGSGNYVFPVVNYSVGPKYTTTANFDTNLDEYGTVKFTFEKQ